jgi:hypothetical protein
MAVDALARVPGVARALEPLVDEARRRPRLDPSYAETVALSIVLLPLLTALLVPAIVRLGHALFEDEAAAWGGAVLWATVPATLIIQYHLDGAVYPLLAVVACGLVATGARRDVPGWSVAGGVLLMLGVYVSFSLLAAIPVGIGCVAAVAIDRARRGEGARAMRRAALHLFLIAVAAAATFLVLRFALRFDLLVRYDRAIEYHARWKATVPSELWRAVALLEYALYAGVPLVALWLWRALRGLFEVARNTFAPADLAAGGLLVVLLVVSALGGTSEVSRMWMLLNPFLALSAATGLRALARNDAAGDGWQTPLAWVALTQLVVALFMKCFQEW